MLYMCKHSRGFPSHSRLSSPVLCCVLATPPLYMVHVIPHRTGSSSSHLSGFYSWIHQHFPCSFNNTSSSILHFSIIVFSFQHNLHGRERSSGKLEINEGKLTSGVWVCLEYVVVCVCFQVMVWWIDESLDVGAKSAKLGRGEGHTHTRTHSLLAWKLKSLSNSIITQKWN